jgi:hypothetical protein
MIVLRQYRTKIVAQTRSKLFRQIIQNNAGIPAYFKEFWSKMKKKRKRMRGKARSAVFVRCCLN